MKKIILSFMFAIAATFWLSSQFSFIQSLDEFAFPSALAQCDDDEINTWEICHDDGQQCWYQAFCDPGSSDCSPTNCPAGGGAPQM